MTWTRTLVLGAVWVLVALAVAFRADDVGPPTQVPARLEGRVTLPATPPTPPRDPSPRPLPTTVPTPTPTPRRDPPPKPPAPLQVTALGTVDRAQLRAFVPTQGGALALVGPRLLRFGMGRAAPEEVAKDVQGGLRRRAGQIFFVLGAGESRQLGVVDLATAGFTRHPLPGLTSPELRHVYSDLRTFVVAAPGLELYRLGAGRLGPLPKPPGCKRATFVGTLPPTRAVLACDGAAMVTSLSGPLPFLEPLGPLEASAGPAPGEALVEEDRLFWPLWIGAADPTQPRARWLIPTSAELPPVAQQRAAVRIAGADMALVEAVDAAGGRSAQVVRRGVSRTAKVYLQGELDPVAAHLPAHDWLVWWETGQLVVMDLARGRLAARLAVEGELAVLPGVYPGRALPLLRALPGASALDWLVAGPDGVPRLVAGPRELPGVPVCGGGAAGDAVTLLLDDGALVRVERETVAAAGS